MAISVPNISSRMHETKHTVSADHSNVTGDPAWQTAQALCRVQGRFKSIMAVITPCRSDLSKHGLAPSGHLSDGQITLVMVRECSRVQYLRFLSSIPQTGKSVQVGTDLDLSCMCQSRPSFLL